jgi:hypothetical protein
MKLCEQKGGTHVGVLRPYETETAYRNHMPAFYIGRKRRHYTGFWRSCAQIDFEFLDKEMRLRIPAKRRTEQDTWQYPPLCVTIFTRDHKIDSETIKGGVAIEN